MNSNRKQRIICIHTGGNNLRGSEYSLLEIMQGFNKAGRDVMLLCDQPGMLEAAAASGRQVYRIPSGELMFDPPNIKFSLVKVLKANFDVLRRIRSFRADIVYCNGGRSCQSALLAAGSAGVPIVVHLRAPYPKRYHFLYGTPLASAVIHTSGYVKSYHESRARFRRSCLILNGVHFDSMFKTTADHRENSIKIPPVPPGSVVLGFMGSLIHRKGIDILIEAVARLRKENRPVFLLIGGRGDSLPYEKQIKQLDLEKCVYFLGEVTDVVRFYSKIDVHVLPSRSEAFGRTIVEAAACGKPSVAHAVGGIPEAIYNCRFGELYSPNNPEKLAQAISKVIDNDCWKAASGEMSAMAKINFGVERSVNQILSVLDAT